jgi:SAM-dependent methyltransferase
LLVRLQEKSAPSPLFPAKSVDSIQVIEGSKHMNINEIKTLLDLKICYTSDKSLMQHISRLHPKPNAKAIVADVGCGRGGLMSTLRKSGLAVFRESCVVGFDIFRPYLLDCKKVHDDVVLCDIRCLPLKDRSVDVVVASEVVEHMPKADGLGFIEGLERVSKGTLALTLPVGENLKAFLEDDNPYQAHLSSWHPDEFTSQGFVVHGFLGAKFLRGERNLFRITVLGPALYVISVLSHFFTQRFPTASSQMLCIKTNQCSPTN